MNEVNAISSQERDAQVKRDLSSAFKNVSKGMSNLISLGDKQVRENSLRLTGTILTATFHFSVGTYNACKALVGHVQPIPEQPVAP